MTLEAALITAITVLAGIVSWFFKILFAAASECKDDRQRLSDGLAEVQQVVAVFKACPEENCPALKGLKKAETYNVKPSSKP